MCGEWSEDDDGAVKDAWEKGDIVPCWSKASA